MNKRTVPLFSKGKSYNNIKLEATADQLFQAANALGGLSVNTLVGVNRNDSSELIIA